MIELREANKDDLKKIAVINKTCELGSWTETDYRKELDRNDSVILLAILKNEILGFLSARFTAPDNGVDDTLELAAEKFRYQESDIINIGVINEYQGLGAGSALIKDFKNRCLQLNIQSVWLEVREKNQRAIDLYLNNGFVKIQIRTNFYANPSDNAIIMKLDLGQFAAL